MLKMRTDSDISVVIPVHNEEENIKPLVCELQGVLQSLERRCEIIFVDDGSTDKSFYILENISREFENIRVINFKANCGQTAAFDAGFKHARGDIIITMDGDMQNDPADIPVLLEKIPEYDLVCGWRHRRQDGFMKKAQSLIANRIRKCFTGDDIMDVGCSLKVFKAQYAKKMKLYSGLHRFFPALIQLEGGKVAQVKVNHRCRSAGCSKYNIRKRIFRSFIDLMAVCWMKKRFLNYEVKNII